MRKILIFVFVALTTSSWAQHLVVLKNGSILSGKFSIVENQTKISIQNGESYTASEVVNIIFEDNYYKPININNNENNDIWVFGKRIFESSEIQLYQVDLNRNLTKSGVNEKRFYLEINERTFKIPVQNQKVFYEKILAECMHDKSPALKTTNLSNVIDIAYKYSKCKNDTAQIDKVKPLIEKIGLGIFGLQSFTNYTIQKPFSIVGDYIGDIKMDAATGQGLGIVVLLDIKNNFGIGVGANFRFLKFHNGNASANIPKFDFSVNYIEYVANLYYRKNVGKWLVKPHVGLGFSPYLNSLKNRLQTEYYKPDNLNSILTLMLGVDATYPITRKVNILAGIGMNRSFISFGNTWGRNTVLNIAQWDSVNYMLDIKLGALYNLK